jgi:hypothetical protein
MIGRGYTDYTESYDLFWSRAFWKYKFVFWPRRCEISKKIIWFECAYKGTRMITGPGEPVFKYRWLTKEEYLLAAIKGKIINDRW